MCSKKKKTFSWNYVKILHCVGFLWESELQYHRYCQRQRQGLQSKKGGNAAEDLDKSIIRIGSVSNFVKDVLNDQGEHEHDLTWSDMIFSPVVADILKKIDQKIIILIDEFDIDEICQNFQLELTKDGAKLFRRAIPFYPDTKTI